MKLYKVSLTKIKLKMFIIETVSYNINVEKLRHPSIKKRKA